MSIFWPTECKIIANTVNFYIHLHIKTLKRPNSQTHSKKKQKFGHNYE